MRKSKFIISCRKLLHPSEFEKYQDEINYIEDSRFVDFLDCLKFGLSVNQAIELLPFLEIQKVKNEVFKVMSEDTAANLEIAM